MNVDNNSVYEGAQFLVDDDSASLPARWKGIKQAKIHQDNISTAPMGKVCTSAIALLERAGGPSAGFVACKTDSTQNGYVE